MADKPGGIASLSRLMDSLTAPKKGERMLFLTDYSDKPDAVREGRLQLVQKWYAAAQALSKSRDFALLPLVKYPETGKNNADLPKTAATHDGGHVDDLYSLVSSSNIAIAMTHYSATAPLNIIASRSPSLRVVSMPGVTAEMLPAMTADYKKMQERGKKLLAVVSSAAAFEFTFDGAGVPHGTRLYVDVRANRWELDAGDCTKPGSFINFPSGELFTPPYEGVSPEGRAKFGDSKTSGIWPAFSAADGKVVFLKVEKNRIAKVQGDSLLARKITEDLAAHPNNANIAEVAFGLNESARSGEDVPVLEKEKAGPHIAYGRNDHFGTPESLAGKVTASVHIDFVYTRTTPITATAYAIYPNGRRLLIAERGKVVAV